MQTVEMKTLPKKNREKVSEMKTVEIPIFFFWGGGGMDLNSFHLRNLLPIEALSSLNLTSFHFKNLSLRRPYH